MAITTVLWDWNGTLINDVAVCYSILNHLLTHNGYKTVESQQRYKEIFGFPIIDYYKRAGFDFTKHSFEDLAQQYIDLYVPQSATCPLQEGAMQTLQILQASGIEQVILSASRADILNDQLKALQVYPYFSTVLGISDIYAKSKVDLGLQWLEKKAINKHETVMIGDSEHDKEVADALGIACILFSGGHRPHAELQATGAPVISQLQQLPTLIL